LCPKQKKILKKKSTQPRRRGLSNGEETMGEGGNNLSREKREERKKRKTQNVV